MADPSQMAVSSSSDALLRQQLFQQPAPPTSPTGLPDSRQGADAVNKNDASDAQNNEQPLDPQEREELQKAIQQLDGLVKPLSIGLSVQRIESINTLYVKLLDRETGETIREIPPRKILEMKENIKAFQGLLFDKFS